MNAPTKILAAAACGLLLALPDAQAGDRSPIHQFINFGDDAALLGELLLQRVNLRVALARGWRDRRRDRRRRGSGRVVRPGRHHRHG